MPVWFSGCLWLYRPIIQWLIVKGLQEELLLYAGNQEVLKNIYVTL